MAAGGEQPLTTQAAACHKAVARPARAAVARNVLSRERVTELDAKERPGKEGQEPSCLPCDVLVQGVEQRTIPFQDGPAFDAQRRGEHAVVG